MKKFLLVLCAALVCGTGNAQIFFGGGATQTTVHNKQALFAWDLNDVLLSVDYGSALKHPIYALKIAKIKYKQKKMLKKDTNGNNVFEAAIKKFKKPAKAAKLIEYFATLTKPDANMVTLLGELKNKNHKHAILSNIGQGVWSEQTKRLPAPFLNLFESDVHHAIAHEGPGGVWYRKPLINIYHLFLSRNINRDGRVIVFIDDKMENIIMGQQAGFDVCILFTSEKQLRADLASLNLL